MRRFPGMRVEIGLTTKEKMMEIFSMILSLLSGVALFLFGMSLMGDGLKMVAGNKLEAFLYRMTNTGTGGKQNQLHLRPLGKRNNGNAYPLSCSDFCHCGMDRLPCRDG